MRFLKILAITLFFLLAPAHIGSSGPRGLWTGDVAEARFGGMRSFGFRGSRGMFRSRRSFGRRSFGSRSRFGSRRAPLRGGRRSFFGGMGGFGGGFMGGMAGMFLGGMIGRMMFGGGGYGMGGGGGGIGLLEILLIGGGIFLFMRYLRGKREQAYSGGGHSGGDPYGVGGGHEESGGGVYRGRDIGSGGHGRGSGPVAATYAAHSPAEEGLSGIEAEDSSFSKENFLIDAREGFMKFQNAWAAGDLSPVRETVDKDIYEQCQGDLDGLRREGRKNRLENIEIGRQEIAESWQEEGHDFITVTYEVSLLDYVVSESSGEVVEGSRTAPVRFTEHWTWARPTGSNPWFLSAISQA